MNVILYVVSFLAITIVSLYGMENAIVQSNYKKVIFELNTVNTKEQMIYLWSELTKIPREIRLNNSLLESYSLGCHIKDYDFSNATDYSKNIDWEYFCNDRGIKQVSVQTLHDNGLYAHDFSKWRPNISVVYPNGDYSLFNENGKIDVWLALKRRSGGGEYRCGHAKKWKLINTVTERSFFKNKIKYANIKEQTNKLFGVSFYDTESKNRNKAEDLFFFYLPRKDLLFLKSSKCHPGWKYHVIDAVSHEKFFIFYRNKDIQKQNTSQIYTKKVIQPYFNYNDKLKNGSLTRAFGVSIDGSYSLSSMENTKGAGFMGLPKGACYLSIWQYCNNQDCQNIYHDLYEYYSKYNDNADELYAYHYKKSDSFSSNLHLPICRSKYYNRKQICKSFKQLIPLTYRMWIGLRDGKIFSDEYEKWRFLL